MNNTPSIQRVRVTTVSNDGRSASAFSECKIELTGGVDRWLSEQMSAVNFRLRSSPPGYLSGFHVAGDPTLIVVLRGQFLLRLRDGQERVFSQGDLFIAEDYLEEDVSFDATRHGHQGQVLGELELQALHLKLARR